MNAPASRSGRADQTGQSAVEYLIVLSLCVLALALGPGSALELLVRAIAFRYQMFTFAMSQP
ncbi:MAG: hypothetical protein KJZ83_13915 [Burkholderiaceae bacterium]|nr:hypothetical protein [Burkholderiaceae bacterium]